MFNVSPTILNVPEVVLSENLLFIVTDVWKPKRHVGFRLQMQGVKRQIQAGRLYRELVQITLADTNQISDIKKK